MHPLLHPLFIDYCAYFNGNEDYFECHEVLEEYWKAIAPREKLHPLVGYVQLATGMYHWRRENFAGAARILQKAISNFTANTDSVFFVYIDFDQLIKTMTMLHTRIEGCKPFISFQIPITNMELHTAVLDKIAMIPTLDTHYLLNKHMLRDRSDVIATREHSKQLRALNRK